MKIKNCMDCKNNLFKTIVSTTEQVLIGAEELKEYKKMTSANQEFLMVTLRGLAFSILTNVCNEKED